VSYNDGMRPRALAVAVAGLALAACSAERDAPGLDVERVLGHVKHLAETIGPRPGGTEAAHDTAAYIEGALAEAGVDPERHAVGDVSVPEARVGGMVFVHAHTVRSADDNILARFGPEGAGAGAVVFLAHHDTVAGSPGAIDNAVAVGLLLELARELVANPPAHPVVLAFTADEEAGLVGARKLAEELGDTVAFAIALDLIGTDGPLIVNGASDLVRATDLRWLAAAANTAGVDLSAPWPHRIVSRRWPQIERADHGAFTRRGVRAIHLMTRGADDEAVYLAYHTGLDRAERVSRGAVAGAGRMVRALAARPPPPKSDGDLGVWMPVPGNIVVPRWTFVTLAAALVLATLLGLVSSRRPLEPGLGLVAAIAVWLAATAIAFAVERVSRGTYPAPWVHAPGRHLVGGGLVLAGTLVLGAVAFGRWRPWAGSDRYAVAAAGWNLAVGLTLWIVGALEIAWLYLAPAALLAWAPRRRVIGYIAAGVAVATLAVVIAPGFLRELFFHGFLAGVVPLTTVLAIHGITLGLVAAHVLRRVRFWGPGASLAVPIAALAAVVAGTIVLATYSAPCTAEALRAHKLSCELQP
jgi:hypothetical protein